MEILDHGAHGPIAAVCVELVIQLGKIVTVLLAFYSVCLKLCLAYVVEMRRDLNTLEFER
jgi:hypothetical protein